MITDLLSSTPVVKPVIDTASKSHLIKMVDETALGGQYSIDKYVQTINSKKIVLNHIVLAIFLNEEIVGWLSVGANYDIGSDESVIRAYLDFIYVEPPYRGLGIASIATNYSAEFLASNIANALPDLGEVVIPMDLEFSAVSLNATGEACVYLFRNCLSKYLLTMLSESSFVVREIIDDNELAYE